MRTARVPSPEGEAWEPPRRVRVRQQGEPPAEELRGRRGRRAANPWDDEAENILPRRGPGSSYGGTRYGTAARIAPGGARAGASVLGDDEDEEETRGGFGFLKGLGLIVLMLVLGCAAGYGYFQYTTPKVHTVPLPTTPTSTAAPHALVPTIQVFV